ncbi:MAG: hypothetical protein LBG15_04280 [Dysgonamonadaceae bacterium]|jgi:predicted HTH transcriptional regulator|nr:hypothetical protein [Dysgonamonadaceae bacterium]
MYLHDEQTDKEGYTMAAALMFGKESTIYSVCPHYKIDALCRKENMDRYDDRDTVVSENWTIPQTIGFITPENVMPSIEMNVSIVYFSRML